MVMNWKKRIRNNDDCLQDCIAKEVEIEKNK